jgi:hypothetical protein
VCREKPVLIDPCEEDPEPLFQYALLSLGIEILPMNGRASTIIETLIDRFHLHLD